MASPGLSWISSTSHSTLSSKCTAAAQLSPAKMRDSSSKAWTLGAKQPSNLWLAMANFLSEYNLGAGRTCGRSTNSYTGRSSSTC
eukprot:CAMPEP_0115753982 /NCGR_PEP_ID=MMETSP0272-20121206/96626_1 /TAXON_ID=71861 /ORGANISM="Scrippsiella trochoidea, Strain CCMP3099" /LENGTH=84 /DNA_ID=CAMNT_0003199357 /DNA_START=8 /DNA_END=262 /DNA_ORIENTATION=-